MNKFSWKFPFVVLVAAATFAACSSDTKTPAAGDGSTCGNGTVEANEDCDGTDLNGGTCKTETSNQAATGNLTCSSTCKYVKTGCSVPATGGSTGTGGAIGNGGGTSDASQEAGNGGTGTGGTGGTTADSAADGPG